MWQIISTYLGIVIMTMALAIYAKIVLEKGPKISYFQLVILILIVSAFHTVLQLNINGTMKSIIMCVVNITLFKYAFQISYGKSILLTFMYMIILLIPDLIEIFFITKILHLNMEFCLSSYGGTLLANFSTCILFIIIVLILKKYLIQLIKTYIDNNKKIIFFSIITFICIGLFFYTMAKELKFNNNVLLYLVGIIALVSILLSLIKQTMINNKITNDYDKLLEFMKTYEEEIENQRTLRHETKNEFLAIRSKICDKEKEKTIIDYIDEILGDTYLVKNEKYAKFGYLPANGVKGLCYFKTQKAEEQGISVSINISKKIQSSTICNLNTKEQRDFAKILGVFIDNAIEASAESKDKELGIEAYSNLDNEFRMIISNTYNNEIEEEKIGKENFTTKGKNRGHGLLLVNQLVKKNNIFDTKREIKNNIYSQTIIVKNRQK